MAAKKTWSGLASLKPLLRSVDVLSNDQSNARIHSEKNIESIRASLEKFGQVKPIVIKDDVVIAGNGTLTAATLLGWSHIAVADASSLTDEEARAYAIADNRTGELAEWDYAELSKQIDSIRLSSPELSVATGWESDDLAGILASLTPGAKKRESPDDFKEFNEDIETEHECPQCHYKWSGSK